MANMSPGRRTGLGGAGTSGSPGSGAAAFGRSPTKRQVGAGGSSNTNAGSGSAQNAVDDKGLSSPTSVSMQNSFIIKNADESFDQYYQ